MDQLHVYPKISTALGGASHVHYGKRSAIVVFQAEGEALPSRTIRLPLSQIRLALDDGVRVAEIAKAWAYRKGA